MFNLRKDEDFRELKAYSYAKEKITKYFNYLNIDTFYLANNEVDYMYSGYKFVPINKATPILDRIVVSYLYEVINSNDNSKLITLNLRGAHIPYDIMLEEKFKVFKAKSEDTIDINYANYHNKILQTDAIWTDIIEFLSKVKTPVFAILTADHGQSLGEYHNGKQYFVHGAEITTAPIEQKETPFIVYINDAYKKTYPEYAKNIEKKYERV